jgi:hypothetical protein
MTAQETKLFNAFETTLTATMGSSDTTFTVNTVTDSYPTTLAAPFYIVINPDSATNREVVLVTAVNTSTKQLTTSVPNRYLKGSAASSGLSHASGTVVRMAPLQQHIEDINDRVDTIINEAGTAVNTTLFLDEDNMSSNSATKGVTQQSVKAYVDTSVTAQDLDVVSDSGTIDIDLDSDTFKVLGGEGIDTSATATTLTIAGEDASTSNKGIASFASANFAVSSGAVTIKDGGVANAELVNSSITVSDGSNTSPVSLGGTLTFAGTSSEVEVAESSGTVTIGLPATINANTSGTAAGLSATLVVASGGTGVTSLTDKAVLISQDSGTDAVGAVALTTNGQVIIGGAGGPAAATITGGTNVTVTNGANSISIAATDTNTTYSAGDGLDLSGTTFSTDLKSNGGLVIESTEVAVDLSASSITGTLDTADGGTGLTSYTAGDLVYYASGTTLTKLAKGSANQVLAMNSGASAPEWVTSTTGDITAVVAGTGLSGGGTSGSVTLNVSGLAVAQGGTGATAFADKSVIITQDTGTDTLAAVAMDANGELLIGGTSGPAVGTLTAGTGVTITNADGAITIAASDVGDITAVTAGTNLSGGGTSGAVTVNLAIDAAVAFADQTASAIVLKDYAETEQAVTSGATLTISLANGNTGTVTLGHNVTDIDFTNVPTDLVTFTLVVTQDGTGSRTMAINAITVNADSHQTAKTAGGAGLTLSTAAASIDILTFMFVDETPYLFSQLAFA